MLLLIQILLGLTIVINAFLALVVLNKDRKKKSSIYFSVFLIFITLWAAGDWIMLFAREEELIRFGAQLFYLAPMVTTLMVLLFSETFPNERNIPRHKMILYSGLFVSLFAIILIDQSFVLESIEINESNINSLLPSSPGYTVYSLYFNLYFLIAYINLFRSIRRNTGFKRSQVLYSFAGILLASFLAVYTNTTLPLQGEVGFVWLGPIFTIILASTTTMAIVRHRLFDLRKVFARAIAYLSVLSFFFVIYLIGGVFVARSIFKFELSVEQQFFYVAVAAMLAVSYQPLKKFFDQVTNRLFYRDAYNSQELLNNFTDLIVSTIDIEVIVSEMTELIESSLKPASVEVHITSKLYTKVDANVLSLIKGITSTSWNNGLLETSALPDGAVRGHLELEQIDLVFKISTKDSDVGFLVLSPKKNGGSYSSQDIEVLSLMVAEFGIAFENYQRYEEIKLFSAKLEKEVQLATNDLKKSNQKLKALDEAKDEFIGMASHQLRTPLTSVKGYLSMVMEGDAGEISSKQHELLGEAFTSSQRMVYLIADLLNVSRLKTGKFIIEKAPINLAEVVEGEIKQLFETAKSRKLTLEFNKPKNFPTIELDETKIRQVIMNFADNAIYYTPAGGKISIRVKATKDTIEYKVVDNGIGVKAEDQKHLFTKFFRASNAKRARPDGTGLGLYMAKKVVTAQGGTVIFESKEGSGSTFGFSFPRSKTSK